MADTRTRLTDLPADPHSALAVHFGMLLGVSDIELLAANPRGKIRLHNAWLHGAGVVRGFEVAFDAASRELSVDPGLALDQFGRELYLANRMCLDLDKWHAESGSSMATEAGSALMVDVVVRHRACLDRPVPAIAGECDDSPETAYSRVRETVQIALEPAADPAPTTFLRLRAAVAAGPGSAAMDAAAAAALDSLDLEAPDPEADGGVVVARVAIQVDAAGTPDIAADGIDHTVRRVHVPTMVVSELLAVRDGPGPRLDAAAAEWEDEQRVSVPSSLPLHEPTLAGGVVAHAWDADAANWRALSVTASFGEGRLRIDLGKPVPAGTTVRVVVLGSGPTPVVADRDGSPVPISADIVLTLERS